MFAFVDFRYAEHALNACAMDGETVGGFAVRVEMAQSTITDTLPSVAEQYHSLHMGLGAAAQSMVVGGPTHEQVPGFYHYAAQRGRGSTRDRESYDRP